MWCPNYGALIASFPHPQASIVLSNSTCWEWGGREVLAWRKAGTVAWEMYLWIVLFFNYHLYTWFFLLNVTSDVPNAGQGLKRLSFKQEWDVDLREYMKKLDAKKPVILCGDLNVAHLEIGKCLQTWSLVLSSLAPISTPPPPPKSKIFTKGEPGARLFSNIKWTGISGHIFRDRFQFRNLLYNVYSSTYEF